MSLLNIFLLATCVIAIPTDALEKPEAFEAKRCKAPVQGPPGQAGEPGLPSPPATADSLYDYNITGSAIVTLGEPIAFNQTPFITGTSLSVALGNSFIFNEAGTYFVNFVGYTDAPTGGGVVFRINGNPTGPSAVSPATGGALVLQQIINAQPGDILQVISSQTSTFIGDNTATISIIKLL